MKSPCDNCPYFWEEKNRSCRDECESYKEWKGLGKLDDTLKMLESCVPLPTVNDLAKREFKDGRP